MGTERAIQVPSDWAARHRSGAAWLDEQLDYLPREITRSPSWRDSAARPDPQWLLSS